MSLPGDHVSLFHVGSDVNISLPTPVIRIIQGGILYRVTAAAWEERMSESDDDERQGDEQRRGCQYEEAYL